MSGVPATDIASLVGSRVEGLKEYAPEPLEALAARLGVPMGGLIKLDANENPYGPTEFTRQTVAAYAHGHRYPDPISRRLRQSLGEHLQVDPQSILVGNGSDELIDLILRLFRPSPPASSGTGERQPNGIAEVIDCPPTFGMYSFYGATNDMKVTRIPRKPPFSLDVDAIEARCQQSPEPKALFVASPNNPDGQLLPNEDLERLLALPLLVILDEAYVEFAADGDGAVGIATKSSRVPLVAERDNLVVLRTFSKWAGLAGLRVGYGVFPAELHDGLYRLKSPYNVNTLAQVAAQATIEDLGAAQKRVEQIVQDRDKLLGRLRDVSFLDPYPSATNFCLCRIKSLPIDSLRSAMEARGIILRYYDASGIDDCVRITVGTAMQNEALLLVLRKLDEEIGNGN